MSFNAPQIGEMADNVDSKGMSHEDAAAAFIANHRAQIDLWKN
jgi:ABC-type proline/glycine betaine transport system substrate-binding protein